MELVTVDTIINWLKTQVEQKNPISPVTYLDAAIKLQALMADETDKLTDLEQQVAQDRLGLLKTQEKRNVSEVKMIVEASHTYKLMRRQQARVDQIEQFIMLAKKYATLKDREYGSN